MARMNRATIVLVALLATGWGVAALSLGFIPTGTGDAADATRLPTACDNLVAATRILVRDGMVDGIVAPDVFSDAAAQDPYSVLDELAGSCELELASGH